MKPRSLLVKILLMFGGVLLFLGCIVTASLWKLSQKAVPQQVNSDVQLASKVVRQFLRQSRRELGAQATQIAQQPTIRAIITNREFDAATLKDRLDYYRLQAKADGLTYYGADGKPQSCLGLTPTTSTLDPKAMDVFHDTGIEQIDGFRTCQKGLLLSASVPIKIGAMIVGYISVYRRLDNAVAIEMAHLLGTQVTFQFQKHVVATSLPGFGQVVPDQELGWTTFEGVKYGTFSFPIWDKTSGERLDIAVLRSQDDATATYRQLFDMFMFLLPISLLVAIVIAGYFARGLISNLQTVVRAANELSNGRWPERLAVTSKDEVGILQEVFNNTVDSLRSAQDRLMAMIDLDPLTELHNHRSFKEALNAEAARSRMAGEDLALTLVDIDHFKEFNEQHGLTVGDQALREIAEIIRANTHEFDRLARFGGNVFAILQPNSDCLAAEACAERIRNAIKDQLPELSVSIGCAEFGINTSEGAGLIIAAELALARAKQLGRDRVCRFDSVPGAEGDADPFQLYKYMQDASLATIQALAAAVDAKDAYTKGHSVRVAEYSRDLAKYVGLSESIQELTYRTGTLHDVGKIGVPDSVLKKPGRLDEDERAIMETHPVLGELIVRKAPQLEDTVPGVRHHHEAWSGTGYPDGLAGEDIPLIARLLAIADTYDAMTSDRPYRKGLAVEIALSEIRKGAGTQFDPELALAFVEMMESVERQAA